MEIIKLSANALRIKGKKASILVDVLDIKKTEASAYLFLTEDVLKVGYSKEKLLIAAAGDYEIAGSKITVSKIGNELFYAIFLDGIKILIANASGILAAKDKIDEQKMILLRANESIEQSSIANVQPAVVVCYGEKAKEVSAILGKGLGKKDAEDTSASIDADIKPTEKYIVTAEKLPTELEIILLG